MQIITSPLSSTPIFGPDNNRNEQREFERLRKFFTGQIKTTKTTWAAASGPHVFAFDVEDKYELAIHDLRNAGITSHCLWTVPRTLSDFEVLVRWVCTEGKKAGITEVAVDTVDELLYGLVLDGLTKEFKEKYKTWTGDDIREFGSSGKGSKGWDIVNQRILGYFRAFHQAGLGWTAIGHVKEREVTRKKPGGGEDKFTIIEPSVNDGIRRGLYRAAELIGTFGWKATTIEIPQPDLVVAGRDPIKRPPLQKTSTVPVLRLVQKQGDQDQIAGCNVQLPEEIVLPYGKGYATVKDAYVKCGQTGASE